MLRSIGLRNYRAFRSAKYPIRPVTIFLGSNSVGKTSALQMPLLLKQTSSVAGKSYSSALKVHGRDVSFGEPINLFHKRNTENTLGIDLTISDARFHQFISKGIATNLRATLNNLIQYIVFSSRGSKPPSPEHEKIIKRLMIKLEKNAKEQTQDTDQLIEDILTIKDNLSDQSEANLKKLPIFRSGQLNSYADEFSRSRLTRGTINIKTVSRSDLERTFRFLKGLAEIPNRPFEFSFGLAMAGADSNRFLRIERFSISTPSPKGPRDIFTLNFSESGSVEYCSSDLLPHSEINAYKSSMSDNFVSGSDIFSFAKPYTASVKYIFPEIVRQLCHTACSLLHETFGEDAIRHIGPLRAYPKRFYFLDTAQAGSADGDSLIEALRENPSLKKQVNEWLSRFGVNLNVNQFQEIIHRLAIRSGGNAFELDITDVGFGISQILPILVEGYISPPGTIVIAEQPEIHLHPKMQGDLADLFISMSGARNPRRPTENPPQKYFLIETHSEYLLNRLRRRIAEGTVNHEDVAIVIADRHEDGSTILESVPISPNGSFRWPSGFQEASLDDALGFAAALAAQRDR